MNSAKHISQYFLMILIFLLTIFVITFVSSIFWRFVLVFSLASLYLGYGVYHHHEEKNLKLSVFLEYLFVAIIIFLVLFSLFR